MMDQRERLARELCLMAGKHPDALVLVLGAWVGAWTKHLRDADHLIAAGWVQKAEVVEECAKAECYFCRQGWPLKTTIELSLDSREFTYWRHWSPERKSVACQVQAIRALAPPAVVDNTQGVG